MSTLTSLQLKRELTLILDLPKDHDFMVKWSTWEEKAFALAKIEAPNRPSIRKIHDMYNAYQLANTDNRDDGEYTYTTISLLHPIFFITNHHLDTLNNHSFKTYTHALCACMYTFMHVCLCTTCTCMLNCVLFYVSRCGDDLLCTVFDWISSKQGKTEAHL